MHYKPTANTLHILALSMTLLLGCMDTSLSVTSPVGGPGNQGSTEAEIQASGPSCDTGCDDANPCTEDSCESSVCSHTPIADCNVYACNSLGVMDTAAMAGLEAGDLWKVSGSSVVTGEPSSCTEEVCEGTEACCNVCDAGLALDVGGAILDNVSTDQDVNWACSTDECGEPLACEPLHLDAGYWLWGVTETSGERLEHVVQGWCRKTTADALPGEYIGTWAGGSEAHTVHLTISHAGTWSIAIQGLRDCPACDFAVPMQLATSVVVRDGGLEFTIMVCSDAENCTTGTLPVKVSLSSHRDRLIGTFAEELTFQGGLGTSYEGAIGLERAAP